MKIETKRLKLIPCSEVLVANDSYPIGPHILMHLEELKEDPTLYGWGPWLVFLKETGEIIGDIGFKGKPGPESSVEIGYGITPAYQKKGYATEAVKALINWAFATKRIQIITAECLYDNHASIRVLEKLGMVRVGTESNLIKWALKKEGVKWE